MLFQGQTQSEGRRGKRTYKSKTLRIVCIYQVVKIGRVEVMEYVNERNKSSRRGTEACWAALYISTTISALCGQAIVHRRKCGNQTGTRVAAEFEFGYCAPKLLILRFCDEISVQ
jgi:hypothetical protein